jgi:hypothetical protein
VATAGRETGAAAAAAASAQLQAAPHTAPQQHHSSKGSAAVALPLVQAALWRRAHGRGAPATYPDRPGSLPARRGRGRRHRRRRLRGPRSCPCPCRAPPAGAASLQRATRGAAGGRPACVQGPGGPDGAHVHTGHTGVCCMPQVCHCAGVHVSARRRARSRQPPAQPPAQPTFLPRQGLLLDLVQHLERAVRARRPGHRGAHVAARRAPVLQGGAVRGCVAQAPALRCAHLLRHPDVLDGVAPDVSLLHAEESVAILQRREGASRERAVSRLCVERALHTRAQCASKPGQAAAPCPPSMCR